MCFSKNCIEMINNPSNSHQHPAVTNVRVQISCQIQSWNFIFCVLWIYIVSHLYSHVSVFVRVWVTLDACGCVEDDIHPSGGVSGINMNITEEMKVEQELRAGFKKKCMCCRRWTVVFSSRCSFECQLLELTVVWTMIYHLSNVSFFLNISFKKQKTPFYIIFHHIKIIFMKCRMSLI